MNRSITAVSATLVALSCLVAPRAFAQAEMSPDEHNKGGLGFHNTSAPVGVRWWLAGQKIGLDFGFGFRSQTFGGSGTFADEKVTGWAIDAGVPFVLKSWNKVHVLFRPGLLYDSQQIGSVVGTPPAFTTDDETTFTVSGEIEGECFLADNFSVSAAHGIGFNSVNPPGPGKSITSFATTGGNFTTVGFHIYCFGGPR